MNAKELADVFATYDEPYGWAIQAQAMLYSLYLDNQKLVADCVSLHAENEKQAKEIEALKAENEILMSIDNCCPECGCHFNGVFPFHYKEETK